MSSQETSDKFPTFSLTGVRPNPNDVAITTAVSRLFKNDPKRVAIIVSNNSASHCWIKPKNDVSSTLGIKIQSAGGYYELRREDWHELVTGEWYIVGAGSVTIMTLELLEY